MNVHRSRFLIPVLVLMLSAMALFQSPGVL